MEKYIYDKNNGLWYELQGDYYIPCLTVPAQEERAHRDLGSATPAVHQGRAQSPVHGAADQRQAEHLSGRHQRAGNGANAPDDKTDGRA